MAKAIQKITLDRSEDIPFDKLELSQKNVRNIKAGVSIEDLANDIALRGLLMSEPICKLLPIARPPANTRPSPNGCP